MIERDERRGGTKILAGRRAYVAALFAVGMSAGVVFAQEGAVDPVNISGGGRSAPSAAVPTTQKPEVSSKKQEVITPVSPAVTAAPATAPAASPTVVAPTVVAPAGTPSVVSPSAQPVMPVETATPVVTPAPVPAPAPIPAPAPVAETPPAPAPTPAPAPEPSAVVVTPPPATAPSATAPVEAKDTKVYAITGLKIDYLKAHPQHPPIEQLMNTLVRLGVSGDTYVSPHEAANTVSVKLGDVGKYAIHKISKGGIEAIYAQVVRFYNERGIIGVFVVVDSKDIDATDKDIRPADRQTLQMVVVTSRIRHVRTVSTGTGASDENRIDDPRFARIKENSPLQTSGKADGRMDLLNRDTLDNYVLRLNRQNGRRVDVAVSGTDQPGEVDLDYLISQNRSWYAYFQVANTGTRQTQPWRERFGYTNNQLTGNDDNFLIDYVTAGFDASHTLVVAYDLPVMGSQYLRYKVFGTFNQFTASDVGQSQENFTGTEWTIGNELAWTVYQKRELFVDLVGGLRYLEVTSDNQTTQVHGFGEFFVPYVGAKLERETDVATTTASLTLAMYHTTSSADSIEGLGRSQPSTDPVVLQFALGQSAYLEPLLFPDDFARGRSTLAHELYGSVRGQWAFNKRLFPQIQDVAGGFYTVRGYPESIVAGDSVVIATGEYRFHFPRILPVQSDPAKTPFLWDKSFRWSPSQPYGRPDWDLIGRAFVDVAQVSQSQSLAFERDVTLVGTGVGVELQYKSHLNLRVDWGVALTDVPDLVEAGSNRFHISATLLY